MAKKFSQLTDQFSSEQKEISQQRFCEKINQLYFLELKKILNDPFNDEELQLYENDLRDLKFYDTSDLIKMLQQTGGSIELTVKRPDTADVSLRRDFTSE
jgi:hypothetical protein